jgi:hypothetical protein
MIEFIKAKIIWIVVGIGILLVAIFSSGLYSSMFSSNETKSPTSSAEPVSDKPMVVKTVPDSLDQSTILPTQTIEITFSHALENLPETRWEIQPSADIKSKLSDDRKTLILTPSTPFNLGQSYTLFIRPDTKIEGKKTLEKEYIYHFKTIEFKGA